ncbi:MAG: MBL fold metallo-hydrolase, partial [Oscillibacter sp.]|nr:MBL fold metallo-hydrolase [Oscillibacter sp.]
LWRDAGCDAADQLLSMGCRGADALILTHFDSDHVNGAEHLFCRVPVRELLIPAEADDGGGRESVLRLAAAYRVPVREITEVTVLPLADAVLTLYPSAPSQADNDRGLAVLASAGESDLLLTGDMSRAAEKKLLQEYDLPDIEALVAGHHGAADATGAELLSTLDPETVLISVGSNSYGHPSCETLLRLTGREVYRTDRHGNIHLTFS